MVLHIFSRSPIIGPVYTFFEPVPVIILPIGYQIIKDVDFPWSLANIVYQHHERLEGSGYPQGLMGDEICLEAKIISVADVVEAITSHRPYRPALGIDVALQEIERGSGQIYDPIVDEACTKLLKSRDLSLTPLVSEGPFRVVRGS